MTKAEPQQPSLAARISPPFNRLCGREISCASGLPTFAISATAIIWHYYKNTHAIESNSLPHFTLARGLVGALKPSIAVNLVITNQIDRGIDVATRCGHPSEGSHNTLDTRSR